MHKSPENGHVASRVVLLVDDSEADQFALRRALRNSPYETIGANTVGSALELVAERHPDVILLDYNLPDGNGLEFIERLTKQMEEEVPSVVMLTGSSDEGMAVAAMKAGASDYMIKDVECRYLKLVPLVVERALREFDERREKRKMAGQLLLAANVYHNIAEGIIVTTPDGAIVSVNPAFCVMTGYAEEELAGANPRIIKSDRHDREFYQVLWASIRKDGCWQGDIWNRRKDGNAFLCRETITAIRDDKGRLQNYVGVLVDLTEAKRIEELVHRQVHHDPLTN